MADFISAFKKVETIIEAAWTDHGVDPDYLSIDDLHEIVQARFGISIKMIAVAFKGKRIKGVIERYELDGKKSAVIYVRRDQPEDELRLTAVKELCHVIVDDNADFSADGLATLSGLIQGLVPDVTKGSLWSEHLARIMANELVYPHENRQPDADMLARGETTIEKLSLLRRVPNYIVSNVLSPSYIKACRSIWERVYSHRQSAGDAQ